MKRSHVLAAVASASVTAAVIASTGGAQSPTTPPTGTLQLVGLDREATFKSLLDTRPKRRESVGDSFLIRQKVRNTSNRRVGDVHAVFTTTGRLVNTGQVTFRLRRGRIMLQGIAEDRGRGDNIDTLAIVGGTGAYESATGTATILSRRKSTGFRLDFGG